MVDKTGEVATLGGVYDGVVVDAEHVAAADALLLIALLTHVGDHLPMEHDLMLEVGELTQKSTLSLGPSQEHEWNDGSLNSIPPHANLIFTKPVKSIRYVCKLFRV